MSPNPDSVLQQAIEVATSKRVAQLADDALRELKQLKQQEDVVIKQIEQHQ